MNTIPHSRTTRQFFYEDIGESLLRSVQSGNHSRMRLLLEIPETNASNDVFRVGTLLEAIRVMAGKLTQDGKRVRICVQGSMGRGVFQGLPLQLSGFRKLLDLMDWQEEVAPFVEFGAVGPEECCDEDDIFIIVCPQNIVGASLIPKLEGMCEAAGKRPVILLNPKLVDIPSSGGLMQVAGRKERIEFAESFEEVYHFRLLYKKPYFHPIYGALRYSEGHGQQWEVYKRVVQKRTEDGKKEEKYCFAKSYEKKPQPPQLTEAIAMSISF